MTRAIRVLLDANVLVDAQVRDLLLRLADADLIDVRWSTDILVEVRETLVGDLSLAPERVDRLLRMMRQAFPEAEAPAYRHLISSVSLPDENDRHVLAAALASECDFVVTENLRDFPVHVLEDYDLVALSIDDALSLIVDQHGEAVVPVVERQIAVLRDPPVDMGSFLRRLSRSAPRAAIALGVLADDDAFARLATEAQDVESETGPHEAVRELLDWILDEEIETPMITVACRELLSGKAAASDNEVRLALRSHLADVCASPDDWGFASARRPQAPNIETVLLLRAGGEFRVAFEQQEHPGHTFDLEHSSTGWTLLGIDAH